MIFKQGIKSCFTRAPSHSAAQTHNSQSYLTWCLQDPSSSFCSRMVSLHLAAVGLAWDCCCPSTESLVHYHLDSPSRSVLWASVLLAQLYVCYWTWREVLYHPNGTKEAYFVGRLPGIKMKNICFFLNDFIGKFNKSLASIQIGKWKCKKKYSHLGGCM